MARGREDCRPTSPSSRVRPNRRLVARTYSDREYRRRSPPSRRGRMDHPADPNPASIETSGSGRTNSPTPRPAPERMLHALVRAGTESVIETATPATAPCPWVSSIDSERSKDEWFGPFRLGTGFFSANSERPIGRHVRWAVIAVGGAIRRAPKQSGRIMLPL